MFKTATEAADCIQGARYKGQKNGLENMRALLAALGNPQNQFRSVHIAGTNGKGSTAAYTESILRQAGYRTGMYTSPYLITYNERVQVMGKPIPDADLISLTSRIRQVTETLLEKNVFPTTFELGTALAFAYFAQQKVDFAVIEVGIGGRLDSTNVILPEIALVAAIGLDHTKILGDTVEAIAREKAGIFKPDVPCVVQDQQDSIVQVFRETARERGCPLTIAPMPEILEQGAHGAKFRLDGIDYETRLCGRHQLKNASLAICAMKELGVDQTAIRAGIARAKWPCRLEWVNGVLIDGAHNPQGARALRDYLESCFPGEKITLVTGMMRDKQMEACAAILAPLCKKVICTAVEESRAASPEELAEVYAREGAAVQAVAGVGNALEQAMAEDGIRVFAGSLYIAGAVRELLAGSECF